MPEAHQCSPGPSDEVQDSHPGTGGHPTWPHLLLSPPHAAQAAWRTHMHTVLFRACDAPHLTWPIPSRPPSGPSLPSSCGRASVPILGSHSITVRTRLRNNRTLGAAFPRAPCTPEGTAIQNLAVPSSGQSTPQSSGRDGCPESMTSFKGTASPGTGPRVPNASCSHTQNPLGPQAH